MYLLYICLETTHFPILTHLQIRNVSMKVYFRVAKVLYWLVYVVECMRSFSATVRYTRSFAVLMSAIVTGLPINKS